ncbi:hypothetical protein HAX54_015173 [Datura stramonium]|uniref:Uncharacterized protein n=1 Tax=Datura stramonium TaxID=4076 RepID=A0ABS8Y2J7_DATST|nr:hypothetical protein [Datura stramonium]
MAAFVPNVYNAADFHSSYLSDGLLTESETPANSPPYCIFPLPLSGSVPSPSTQTPPHYAPEPPVFNPPPMIHPSPPTAPYKKPENAIWCVAKTTVAEVLLQPVLDYACGSGWL